jgi:hypothetical protein
MSLAYGLGLTGGDGLDNGASVNFTVVARDRKGLRRPVGMLILPLLFSLFPLFSFYCEIT